MKRLLGILFLFSVVSCGKGNYSDSNQVATIGNGPKKNATSSGHDSTPSAGNNFGSSTDNEPSTNDTDIPFSKGAKSDPVVKIPDSKPPHPVGEPPKVSDIPDSSITINEAPKTAPQITPNRRTTTVTALGTDVKGVSKKLVYDQSSAIRQARACQKTGAFTDGSRCNIIFADGTIELVNDSNRKFITPFIRELED